MKIEKLTLPAASDRRAYDIADMIDIRYHPSVAHVRILDDLHAEVSTADGDRENGHRNVLSGRNLRKSRQMAGKLRTIEQQTETL